MSLSHFLLSFSFWGFIPALFIALITTLLLALFVKKKLSSANGHIYPAHANVTLWQKIIAKTQGAFSQLKRFLTRFGLSPREPLTKTFKIAFETLKLTLGTSDYRYKIPFYLVLGETHSGKKTLLNSLNIPLPIEKHPDMPTNSSCGFWFFEEAVAIDVEGALLMEKEAQVSRKEEWRLFFNLLSSKRPGKPVDGIVLCIPIREILTQDPQKAASRAGYIQSKLMEAHNILGVHLPLYIVITHMDEVGSFKHFCHSVPPENRDDILGWSCPYALDVNYQSTWIDEAIHTISERLLKLQQLLWTKGQTPSTREGLTLFPHAFSDLAHPLKHYLDNLFQGTTLTSILVFRGLFFTGDGVPHLEDTHSQDKNNLHTAFLDALQTQDDQVEQENIPSVPSPTNQSPYKRSIYFSTQLFRRKIFAEQGLAMPVRRTYQLSRNHRIRTLQMLTFALVTCGIVGLFFAYKDLARTKQMLAPRLDDIGHVMQRALAQEHYKNVDHTFFQRQAEALLPAVAEFDIEGLRSWIVPFSWLSPLELRLRQVIELAYHYVVFRAIAQKIDEGMQKLTMISQNSTDDAAISLSVNSFPQQTPSFEAFSFYIDQLTLYESMLEKYNNLKNSESMSDFGFLVQNLFGYRLPDYLLNTRSTFQKSFSSAAQSIQTMGFYAHEKAALQKYETLKNIFLEQSFQCQNILPTLNKLLVELNRFGPQAQSYQLKDLKKLTSTLSQTIDFFLSPDTRFLLARSFQANEVFSDLLNKISSLNTLPVESSDTLMAQLEEMFGQFRGALGSYTTPVTGAFFTTAPDGYLTLSPSLLHLQGMLNLLLTQPFMSKVYRHSDLEKQTMQRRIIWQPKMLQKATSMLEDFNTFFSKRMHSLSPEGRFFLRQVCLSSLQKNVRAILHQSQEVRLINKNAATFSPEELCVKEAQSLKNCLGDMAILLEKLKQFGFSKLHSDVRAILLAQATELLETTDTLYEEEMPYKPRIDIIKSWTGDPRQILAAFGASSTHDLKNYLNLQRKRLQFLSHECATPAVDMLKLLYDGPGQRLPNLMIKWADIGTQLGAYSRKSPNTLQMLEDFILTTLPGLRLESCAIVLHLAKNPSGIDYFLDRQNELRAQFSRQCISAGDRAAHAAYRQIADFFNTHLAGLYPFVPKNFESKEEASLENLKTFFKMFDEKAGYIREMLRNHIPKKPHYAPAMRFLLNIDQGRPFFRLILSGTDGGKKPRIPLKLTFRTNKKHERNAHHLLSWSLKCGDKTSLASDGNAQVWWCLHDPVNMTFRWALGSPYRPISNKRQPFLSVDGPNTMFRYAGCWSLLRFLQHHKGRPEEGVPTNTGAKRLRFAIPMALAKDLYPKLHNDNRMPPPRASQLRVFMDIQVVNGPENSTLDMPKEFPHVAPSLSTSEGRKPKKSTPGDVCEMPVSPTT